MDGAKRLLYHFFSSPAGFYDLLVGLSLIHGAFIAPILFKLWIIPKIEKRYQTKLKFDAPSYWYDWSAPWLGPPIELSLDAFLLYIKWNKMKKQKYSALIKINYDIKTASRAEIVMYCITLFSCSIFMMGVLSVIWGMIIGKIPVHDVFHF